MDKVPMDPPKHPQATTEATSKAMDPSVGGFRFLFPSLPVASGVMRLLIR